MRRARWLAPWKNSRVKPVIYHCVSRVVERRFAFGDVEREQFRIYMRMYEKFTGCRVLSYCIMSNHIHILLEVPPMREGGLADEELLLRLRSIYSEAIVADVEKELNAARAKGLDEHVAAIHARYTYRMHNLSEFMKTVMQRMTQWFNREHNRTGTLWESRFTSVIVESGVAARMMAAYIDLNPVRAGMVADPAEYRWSSYGEAVGGGNKGNGKKAREGLVRACMSQKGVGFEAEKWKEVARVYRKLLGMAIERKAGRAGEMVAAEKKKRLAAVTEKSLQSEAKLEPNFVKQSENETVLRELEIAAMLRHQVRYFTAGAVIGSKIFVNEAFAQARDRFGQKRSDGARKMRGLSSAAAEQLWSARDLRVRV